MSLCRVKRLIGLSAIATGLFAVVIPGGPRQEVVAVDEAPRPRAGLMAQPDVLWHRNFGPERGVLEMRVDAGLGDEIVVAAHTNRDRDLEYFSFVGSFNPATGDPTVRHGVTIMSRWPKEAYWDLDAATGYGGSPDYLVVVGTGDSSDDFGSHDKRGFIDLFRDKRDEGRRLGFHWNLVRRVDTEFFQILAVGGLEADPARFLIGAGIMVPNESGGGYDGVVAALDTEGRELWRDRMSNGGVINIHDMVVNGGLLFVVGSVTRYFEGMEPIAAMDGFVRAYRLSRPATGVGERAEHLWTRRFATRWDEVSPNDTSEGLLLATSDRAGNVYVAGYTQGFLPGRMEDERDVHPLGGTYTSFVVKYDAEGAHRWTKQLGADRSTVIRAIAADCAGNVWVGGATQGVFGGESRRAGEPHGAFIVRLDSTGRTTWANSSILRARLGGIDTNWYYVSGLDLDAEGRLFATGSYLDHWGWQPSEGNNGFIAALNDPVPHTMGLDGFARCPPSTSRTTPPGEGGQCLQTPDASVLVLPGGGSVPHEGFRDEPACSNNVDDDNDGLCDAVDPDCSMTRREYDGTLGCMPFGPDIPPAPERFPSPLCVDGIDNDGNGRCDHMEPLCRGPDPVEERIDPIPDRGRAPLPPVTDRRACERSVQGRIAWDYDGNTTWNPENVARLCRGAEDSTEPARCFDRVMHGGVSHGSGTRWLWGNALDLCEGTRDADATISCFQSRIARGETWRQAIAACDTG